MHGPEHTLLPLSGVSLLPEAGLAELEARFGPRFRDTFVAVAGRQPVVTLTGPRQSGKTTLARVAFPDLPDLSLEGPDHTQRAASDPLA